MVIFTAFVFLVLFSIIAMVMSADDAREYRDPHDNPLLWATLGRR
ncbi:MAG TPA: hypothetical protein VIR16_02940 [Candidatus Limnocylindrales bacterium]